MTVVYDLERRVLLWVGDDRTEEAVRPFFTKELGTRRCHTLRVICMDEMGKEAVRDGLKLIKLKNVKDVASMHMAFEGGVLEMHCAYAQHTSGMFGDNQIRELLVKKL